MTRREMTDVMLDTVNESELARAVGVSRSTIARWRQNPDSIPLGKARVLARIHNCRLELKRIEKTYT